MAEFVGGHDSGGTVAQPRRSDTKDGEQRQAINRHSPQQDAEHERHADGMDVDDDVVSTAFLEGVGVVRRAHHHLKNWVHAEKQHQRCRHPPIAKTEACQRECRREEAPEVRYPALVHQAY